ncbi:PAS domain-containing sensor histidine kinase [Candidatus Nitrotoga sp. M5]|uniref:PAS domain-containing sensor histidine kinase n=1 Tax=Candidatus Nitrotoga sp. M5 TaxID=2890409 RepID=UPI001EF4A69A|nr:ATP-binding protein [Candidatus Nitrotoga sp. M5]CAH1387491.1 Histidine kinase [Candidatus Nitrotoga sp. M5]
MYKAPYITGNTEADFAGNQYDPTDFFEAEQHMQATARFEIDATAVSTILRGFNSLDKNNNAADLKLRSDWRDAVLADVLIVDVNEYAVRLVGAHAGRECMIGCPVSDFWPPESRPVLAELIYIAMTDTKQCDRRSREISSYGLLCNPVVTVQRSEETKYPEILFLTISGSVESEYFYSNLKASEEHYRKLFHYIPTALLRIDSNGIVEQYDQLKSEGVSDLEIYLNDHPELIDIANKTVRIAEANSSAVSLLGGSVPADCIGPVGYLFTESPDTARRIMIARFNGTRDYAEIAKVRTLDGRILDVLLSLTFPTFLEERDILFISLEDVTERLQTEAQLRQVQADFTHAARISTLGEMATSIAHEINQPLAAIVTNAETSIRWLARDTPNLSKVEQLITRIAASARRASDIVQRIRIMAAKRSPERALLNLNDVVNDALLFVHHEIDFGSIDLSVQLFPSLPRVNGDRVLLQQVIVNLLINSIHAVERSNGNSRRIVLRTDIEDETSIMMSIHDSGQGIAEDDLDHIFDAFFTTKEDGIGIGLAICQSIVKEHGGQMSASNHPSGGAHFRCLFPVEPLQPDG